MSEQQIRVTLVRSVIGNTQRQRAVARSLGLTKMHKTVVHPDRPEIRGMVRAIGHLVRVETVEPAAEPAEELAAAAPAGPKAVAEETAAPAITEGASE